MSDTSSSTSSDRRAQSICAFGLAVQLAVLAMILGVAIWSKSAAVWAEVPHLGGAVAIWLALLILYTQRKRSRAEAFETAELRRAAEAGTTSAIFDSSDETLHLERYRLRWLYRWFLPGFTVLLALFHMGVYVRWHVKFAEPITSADWSKASNPSLAATFAAFAGFLCFMFSRYASGMARQGHWRMLRAASTYLAGNALACLVLVAALGMELLRLPYAEPVAAYVIRITMLLLGAEFAINFVLDLYRPREADEEPRPAFDSRLLALVSEPGGIARSIAEAINYQFGFEVSATWFYQLLRRSLLPLAVFTLLALFALSSVVIVDADQAAVIEHFGKPASAQVISPGPHLKWPWPIDRVRRASVARVRPLVVGSHAEVHEGHGEEGEDDIILWTEKHEFTPHMMLLVAGPELTDLSAGEMQGEREAESSSRSKAVAVSMLMCSTAIQYRINDLANYLYNYAEPEKVLEAVAYQAMTDYAASVEIDQVIGPGREEFQRGLRRVVEERISGLGLGIEIVFVGLQGAHPPTEGGVARAFQDVVAAERRKEAAVEEARGKAQMIKTRVAGSVERADLLDGAVREMDRLAASVEEAEGEQAAARQRVDDLLQGNVAKGIRPMSGQAAADVSQAEAARTVLLSEAESKRRVFASELAAYEAAPRLYQVRKYLGVLTESVKDIRKFVLVGDRESTNLIIEIETEKQSILDLTEPGPGASK
ncbi:MAG: SPFH domain-containing protein [Planctomycetota bacterium]|jgi:regulator of protease activity HflC (stomatin/prohibitin superfamily)/divalent metal cation (Fe/Co/Zn/Cd) transporter